jgi:hypothetical protein
LRGRITRSGRASGNESKNLHSEIFERDKILHTRRPVCFAGMLRDSVPYDHCHLVPPRRPLPLLPLPLPAECHSQNMTAPHLTLETWSIGKVAKAVVVVHGKGADSAADYPFLSDVKIQT